MNMMSSAFGVAASHSGSCYIIRGDNLGFTLHSATGDELNQEVCYASQHEWSRFADTALADFNRRLVAKNRAAGLWPGTGEMVKLHPCFGRELELVMMAATESYQLAPVTIPIWAGLNGNQRKAIWDRAKSLLGGEAFVQQSIVVELLAVQRERDRKTEALAFGKRRHLLIKTGDRKAIADAVSLLANAVYEGEDDKFWRYRAHLREEAKYFAVRKFRDLGLEPPAPQTELYERLAR